MTNRLMIRRYEKSEREQVFEFMRSAYSPDRSAQLIYQWNWKYDANPFNCETDPYILLVRDGGKVVGMMGAIPLRACIAGKERLIRSGCDWIIHADYRGRGLMRRMDEQYVKDHPIGFGWSNVLSNRIYERATNAGSVRIVPLVKPLIPARFRLFNRKRALSEAGDEINVVELDSFDDKFDALWGNVRCQYPVMIVRDQRYLSWRFDSRPDAKYTRACAMRGTDLLGYIVYRLAVKDGSRRGYLVDWMIKDQSFDDLSRLVRYAADDLQEQGATFISARMTMPAFRRMFYRLGFVPWHWGAREYLVGRIDLTDSDLQVFKDPAQWYATMGDGDEETSF